MECYKEIGNVIYSYDELLKQLKTYITDEKQLKLIYKAYMIAKKMHVGQKRKSGEEYIVHPLNVAYIASTYKLDYETICAALLHDVVEDTSMDLSELSSLFGERIALLVDGVTKITNMKFSTKNDELRANQNKILKSMCEDVRIIFIKLADRLHNMRTMSSMQEKKQILKSNETYEIYVPLAYRYGLYRVKEELEDISFYYRNKAAYQKVSELLNDKREYFYEILASMKNNISKEFIRNGLTSEINPAIKNVHGVHRRLEMGLSLENMHDLLALRIILPETNNCYQALGILHSIYSHIDGRFKDYLYTPKSNNYRSLHTVLFSGTDYLVQARLRTKEMDCFATSGILTYFQGNESIEELQTKLSGEFRFFREISASINETQDASKYISEQFDKTINIYTQTGEKIELPLGSTPLDVAFKLGEDYVMYIDSAFVNNRPVSLDYKLRDGDILKMVKNEQKYAPTKKWIHMVKTNYAKEHVKTYIKK